MHVTLPIPLAMLAELSASDLLPVAGILMLTTGMMMIYRKRHKNQQAHGITPHEQLERNHQLRGVRGDLELLMVEIEQLSKRFAAQLDAKSTAIELLLRQADARIAEMKRLSLGNGNAGQAPPPAAAPAVSPPPRDAAEEPADPITQAVHRLADQGLPAQAIAGKLNEHVGKVELILALRSAR
jgi:hypothetical protein